MPWKASLKGAFALSAALLDGEPISNLCREFGISRKTGYKIYSRYREARLVRSDRPLAAA